MRNPNQNAKKLQNDDRIKTYLGGSNIPFIKYFDNRKYFYNRDIYQILLKN